MNLQIYPRFRDLLPPLTSAEFDQLEKSILDEGIREPIRTWGDVIVDGHNRFTVAEKHELYFETEEMQFEDEDAVCEWMIVNQLGRRNLEANLKTLFIGQLYELQKKRVGNANRNKDGEFTNSDTVSELVNETKPTAEKIAEEFDVSPRTVERAGKVAKAFEQADEETKEQFKRGEISQKRLVESAKPEQEKTDVIEKNQFNSHTNNLGLHGRRINQAAKELMKVIEEYETYTAASKLKTGKFTRHAINPDSKKTVNSIAAAASGLKTLEVCPLCLAKGCKRCGESGYLDKQNAEYVRKDISKGLEVAANV